MVETNEPQYDLFHLTVFAISLVAAASPQADHKVFVALLPWALLALPKCFGALDCYEDCILFASGVYGLIVLIRTWRAHSLARAAIARSVQKTDGAT